MLKEMIRATAAAAACAACIAAAAGEWSDGKLIATDEGDFMRYAMDLQGGVMLYAVLPTEAADDGSSAVRAVHLVTTAELRGRHWLHYSQENCRWDAAAMAWGDLVVGDRMPVSLPSPAWADDVAEDTEEANAPTALDGQLLAVASAAELITLFDEDRATRATALPAPQMLNEETGLCSVPMEGADRGMVGSVVLIAQMAEGHRVVDVTEAAESLHASIAMDALVGSMATAAMVDVSGMPLGDVTLEQTPTGVLIGVAVSGVAPGAHGIHLHRVGACTPDFKAASGHVNPRGLPHGLRHPDGPDNGDLPLLHVNADGSAMAEFHTTLVSLSTDADAWPPGLLDEDGSAVVIHENPDDHLTQPIGGAGGRVACGVIQGM